MDYFQSVLAVIIANFIPTTEQIGGITLGLTLGLDPLTVLIASLTVNWFTVVLNAVINGANIEDASFTAELTLKI